MLGVALLSTQIPRGHSNEPVKPPVVSILVLRVLPVVLVFLSLGAMFEVNKNVF